MLVCSVSIFMSCSDDDDEVKYPIDTELAGGYVGNLSVNVDGYQMGTTENQKITISQSNKGTNQIALSLKNFTFLVNVGDIEVDPCTVKAIDGGYAFEGQQNLDLVQPLGNCPVSISGTVKGSNINIEIGVKVGAAPLNQNVKATFVGRKLTGSESSEAKITNFIIDDEAVVEQPVINEEAGTIVFAVNEEVESLKFTPIIEISEGATITPASGVAQDFSNNKKVTYTVTAEDGTVKVYTAFVEGTRKVLKYSFEDWKEGTKNDELLPKDLWAGSAAGAGILGGTLLRKETREDGTYAAKLITFEYPNEPNSLVPKITAGSIFIGKFDMSSAFTDRLSCTKFGLDAETVGLGGKPLRFKGVYKYESGSNYLDASNYEDVKPVDIKDKGQIQAVLYKVQTGEDGKEIVLTGHDVNTSELRVAVANIIVEDIKEYTPFNIEFEYLQEYDRNAKYKFAIVCSSSKDGDLFKGAGGSTLIVDEFEVICE